VRVDRRHELPRPEPLGSSRISTDGRRRSAAFALFCTNPALLSIVDRAKDVIITGGENVSSREVEDALSGHPDVDMVAVVGVPDEYWGEAICAVVVPRAGRCPSAGDLIAHARARMSAFKRPRYIVFADTLPLTTNGKIAKDRVRAFARVRTGGISTSLPGKPSACLATGIAVPEARRRADA
jgi:acyl-CoA synthetase (AMP-forming)/AMP-acid ligase II